MSFRLSIFSFIILNLSILSHHVQAENCKTPLRVVIIGGGMAGVSTAHFLGHNSCAEIILLERESNLGGQAQTVSIRNRKRKLVKVDLGPQYFSEGGWDAYISFLKQFDLGLDEQVYLINPQFAMYKIGGLEPYFLTPRWGSYTLSSIGESLELSIFLHKLHQLYKINHVESQNISVGTFLRQLPSVVSEQTKQKIIRPLIAASGNAHLNNVDTLSMFAISKILAFKSPLESLEGRVSREGMGVWIQKIAQKVGEKYPNVRFLKNAAVWNVVERGGEGGGYRVYFHHGTEEKFLEADQLVLATPPPVSSSLLENVRGAEQMRNLLNKLEYTDHLIALHSDDSYVSQKTSSFYNIKSNGDKISITHDLGQVDSELDGIYKSWILTEEDFQALKDNGHLLAYQRYRHPVVTPDFLKSVRVLKILAGSRRDLWFAGGWSHIFETQDSAVRSGFEAAIGIAPQIETYWKKELSGL